MKIASINQRLSAFAMVLAILAAAATTLFVFPGNVAQVEAAQTVDARIAGDVLRVKGTRDDDKLTIRLNAADNGIVEIDVGDDGKADFSFARALFGEINVNALDGNDLVRTDEANGPILAPMSILGGKGNDSLLGGSAADTIDGGDGDDLIDGNQSRDVAFMGDGRDTFRWDPGDGSDVVEGQDDEDTLLFNGANGGETVDLFANGGRFTFFRQPGNITMDVNEVEVSVFNALGGPDSVTVNDLVDTDVTQVNLELEGGPGTGAGDGQQDEVIVNGTAANDAIVITGSAGSLSVTGLAAAVTTTNAEAANDLLAVNALGGDDTIDASGLQADAIKQLTIDGGDGDDLILGGLGADSLTGGDGDDFVDGNQAIDVAFMGPGDDTFRWDPGDASDVVEGGDGNDTLGFNGAGANETVDLAANGERLRFFRDPGAITMDTNEVETAVFNAFGGTDTITVNDLTGTDVTEVLLNLEGAPGSGVGDGQADRVNVNGTAGDDTIVVKGSNGNVNVEGLSAAVAIFRAERANDRLDVNTAAGNDTVDATGLAAGVIQLFVDGIPEGTAVNSLSIAPATQTVAPRTTGISVALEADVTAPGIGAYDIDVIFDNTLLRATACTSNAAGSCDTLPGGQVNFFGKSAGGLAGGSLQLGTITFQADATSGFSPIEVFVNQLTDPNGADVDFTPSTDGEVVVQQLRQGDVDCNNSVDSIDALLMLRFDAGIEVSGVEPCPEIGTVLTLAGAFGDVDCNGLIDSVDALKTLRFDVGLPVAQNEPPPCTDLAQPLP